MAAKGLTAPDGYLWCRGERRDATWHLLRAAELPPPGFALPLGPQRVRPVGECGAGEVRLDGGHAAGDARAGADVLELPDVRGGRAAGAAAGGAGAGDRAGPAVLRAPGGER
jgi:hypothetical protein